jgi:hypothetical protein
LDPFVLCYVHGEAEGRNGKDPAGWREINFNSYFHSALFYHILVAVENKTVNPYHYIATATPPTMNDSATHKIRNQEGLFLGGNNIG